MGPWCSSGVPRGRVDDRGKKSRLATQHRRGGDGAVCLLGICDDKCQ